MQIMARGVEEIGVCPRPGAVSAERDEERDSETLECRVNFIVLRPGSFAVFLPQDGHRPEIRHGAAASVRKMVVKVPVRAAVS
jgi:YhcH/YjgK/YiaL family protein